MKRGDKIWVTNHQGDQRWVVSPARFWGWLDERPLVIMDTGTRPTMVGAEFVFDSEAGAQEEAIRRNKDVA